MTCSRDPYSTSARVEIPQDRSGIAPATEAARRFAAEIRMNEDAARRLRLVVEELLTNCADHGAAPPGSAMRLSLGVAAEGVIVEVEDAGRPFDPRTDLPPERPPVGGLGWALILAWCRLEAVERRDGRNLTRLLFHDRTRSL